MATDTESKHEPKPDADEPADPPEDPYDRSSLSGDFMVMIADQTEEDFFRRHPKGKSCELIDGVVYLHSDASNPDEPKFDPEDPTRSWYDRSSLVGDFMVMIPDQTEEDYLRRCPEGRFCEYIDGIVYMPSPATLWHQFEVQFLAFLLQALATRRRAGIVLTGPAALKVRPDRYLEPDLFVIPAGGEGQLHEVYCDPPVLLVVEVLSKSTRSNDLKRKSVLYREAGAIEVWFVDDRDKLLIVHRRSDHGYEIQRIASGPYHSRALPGFWLDVSWPWARPQPDVVTCLEAIFAGPRPEHGR